MSKAVLIYSGGLDSTTLLYRYRKEIKLAVSFNYGSKHNEREITMAKYHCRELDIPHIVINLKDIFKYFKSSLLKDGDTIPDGHYSNENMASTVVPFRNGIMLSIAAGLAESHNYDTVMIANHYGDSGTYPDCRSGFINTITSAIMKGTSSGIQVVAPFTNLTKKEIAKLGYSLGIKFEYTWSCYKGEKYHCGKCGTCIERIWALQDYYDKTIYTNKEYGIQQLKERGEWNEKN